jgi:ribosomal protein L11 methyltransferase
MITINLPAGREEALAEWMTGADAMGAAFTGEGGAGARVQVYFPASLAAARIDELAAGLSQLAGEDSIPRPERVPDGGWVEAYQRSLRPFAVGRRLWIIPTDEGEGDVAVPPGRHAVHLPPGRAFGTGDHATTALCLEYLDRHVRPREHLLDVGAGSGILSIAAILLGAARAVAVEPDREAAAVLARNLRRNRVGGRVEVVPGTLARIPSGWFDRVVANILAGTLIELMPEIATLLRPGGCGVLSGIRTEEAESVADAAAARGLRAAGEAARDGWVALEVVKPEASSGRRVSAS